MKRTLDSLKTMTVRYSVLSGLVAALMVVGRADALELKTDPDNWVRVDARYDAVMDLVDIPDDAAINGMWSAPFAWPMNGLHSVVLPDGKILTYGTNSSGSTNATPIYDRWDPYVGFGSNSHEVSNVGGVPDSFCASATYLTDGRLMAGGGSPFANQTSGRDTLLFDPITNTRTGGQSRLASPRWYSSMINLPDGRSLVLGGMVPYNEPMADNPDNAVARGLASMTPEVYEDGQWRSLFGATSREAFGPDYLRASYPRSFVAPNGQVFGISAEKMWYLDVNGNGGNGEITYVGDFKSGYGEMADPVNVGATSSAVMYDVGKIIQAGGNGGFNEDGFPASDMATVFDITNGDPILTEMPRMANKRRYLNLIVLPNGEVVATGGTTRGNYFAGTERRRGSVPVYEAEIWNPETGQWRTVDSASTIRVYHSITSLMLNGAIISTGGGTPGPIVNRTGEVFYPPYLFEAANGGSLLASRPEVVGISGLAYTPGDTIQLDIKTDETISSVVFMGLSVATHSFNTGQRRIPVSFSQERNRLTAQVPDANLTPPGYYQVVVLNSRGVPSYGVVVSIGMPDAPAYAESFAYDPVVGYSDTDGDGVPDNQDVFPNDPTESRDSDGDGTGDNADPTPLGDSPTIQPVNLAIGRNVLQSSLGSGGVASRAVDGNTNGAWGGASVTHTENERQPWWRVDLGESIPIGLLRLHNRTDCCRERLSNFYVFISDEELGDRPLSSLLADDGLWYTHIAGQASDTLEISPLAVGRYVTVRLAGTNVLSLAEVEVYGVEASYPDSDGDGVPDDRDGFPDNPSESRDTDGDGVGDNADITPYGDDPLTLYAAQATLADGFEWSGQEPPFIQVPQTIANAQVFNASLPSARFSFTVATAGLYQLKATTRSPDTESNSFYIDTGVGEQARQWNTLISDRWSSSVIDTVYLAAGQRTITVYHRESGTQLQKVRLVLQRVDTDGDRVFDDEDAFPNDASEFQDTDRDGIGDNRDTSAFGDNPIVLSDNIALGRSTRQVSTFSGGVSSRAVDGNTNGNWNAGSVTHTNNSNPWWQLDLGSIQPIGAIHLFNRTDCCSNILSDATVAVSAYDLSNASRAELAAATDIWRTTIADPFQGSLKLSPMVSGRYVHIRLNRDGAPLSLAEVQVYPVQPSIDRKPDRDNDGVPDVDDAFPDDPSESRDSDRDGIGDNADPRPLALRFERPIVAAGEPVAIDLDVASGFEFSWNYGDGSAPTAFSADPDASHVYDRPGLYLQTLSVRNEAGIVAMYTGLQAVATTRTALAPTHSSAIAVSDTDLVWTVNPDNDSVSAINAITSSLIAEIAVGQSPRALAVAPGGEIWVSNKHGDSLSVISPSSMSVVNTVYLPRASLPHGLIFSPDGNDVFVALEGTGELMRIDAFTGIEMARIPVAPGIRHLAHTADGRLLVSQFITDPLANESTIAVDTSSGGGEVHVIDAGSLRFEQTVVLRHSDKADFADQGAGIPNYLGTAAIAPDGRTAWVPSKQDNIQRGGARSAQALNFQNTVRAVASRIDLDSTQEIYADRVDYDNAGVPSAAIYHPSGAYLFVALETNREVAVSDGFRGTELFRIRVGLAPQGVAVSGDGRYLYVQNFMDRSVSVVDLQPLLAEGRLEARVDAVIRTIESEALEGTVLRGKQLFYDAADDRLALDNYLSCASCHNDGEHDGRVWDFTDFGEGLRNTRALTGVAGADGRLHWSGNFDEVQDFESQIRALAGGTGLMQDTLFNATQAPLGAPKAGLSADLDALAAYVRSLTRTDASPYRSSLGTLTVSARNGERIFEQMGCGSCHMAPRFTDSASGALRDVGTISAASGRRLGATLTGIDTPTLLGIWRSAPYLHDGSALSLAQAINAHAGVSLSGDALDDLVDYLRQLEEVEMPTTGTNNSAPVAVNDFIGPMNASQSVTIDVLDNDYDMDGDPGASSVVIMSSPLHGTAVVGSDGQITYTNNGLVGSSLDNFIYLVRDSGGAMSNPAVVTITIND